MRRVAPPDLTRPATHVIGVPVQPGQTPPPGAVVIGTMAWSTLPPHGSAHARAKVRRLRSVAEATLLSTAAAGAVGIFASVVAFVASFWY